ncbi:O-methyltransferase [Nonlabens antarcticus]|uniref:O-methyltransferase n=1 Tax=Nonlabens antarcticus TaxID=392714 RepID=UPI001890FE7E|nr:class I SAM-dependent methyltransferase [Nonlabens antarcticus]
MLHQLKHYIHYRLKSIHLHGIHSPFIFEFNRDCLHDNAVYAAYGRLVCFRESVLDHNQQLQIEDHGAGSKRLQNELRETTQILKHNSSSARQAELLYRIAYYFKVERALELGTSLGMGTIGLALGSHHVTSVEGSPEVATYAQERLRENGVGNVQLIQGTFRDFFMDKLKVKPSGTYGLVFIDGHHNGAATIGYFEQLLPYCNNDTVIIIDDIYWSKDMTHAWQQLTKHPKVTASLNTYQWGLLFFRKEQGQQCFYINL